MSSAGVCWSGVPPIKCVLRALERYPALTPDGFNHHKGFPQPTGANPMLFSLAYPQWPGSKELLEQVAACCAWLHLHDQTNNYNRRHTSYGYKHMVERWEASKGRQTYVSNGAFIAAAIGMGYLVTPAPGYVNAHITISEASIKDSCAMLSQTAS